MVAKFEYTPEWLLGETVDGSRQFVIHTTSPAFLAEIFDEDDPAGILSGITFSMPSGQHLGRFYWYDEPVTEEQAFLELCSRAAQFIAEYDRNLNIEDE